MKINEVLVENYYSDIPKINKILASKGYKFLGRSRDQAAYVNTETGYILKIFRNDQTGPHSTQSPNQTMFLKWYEFCEQNKNNSFLPDIIQHDSFMFNGSYYLQIITERLFPIYDRNISHGVSYLADFLRTHPSGTPEEFLSKYIDKGEYNKRPNKPYLDNSGDNVSSLIMHLGGEQQFKMFFNTLQQVVLLGNKYGYRNDLHSANFMLGSDGHIVINDPWVTD